MRIFLRNFYKKYLSIKDGEKAKLFSPELFCGILQISEKIGKIPQKSSAFHLLWMAISLNDQDITYGSQF